MAKRKVFKTGNSLVVSIPKDALDSLGLEPGNEVVVTVDSERRQIVISPIEMDLAGLDEEFARQVADFIREYRPALQSLAES